MGLMNGWEWCVDEWFVDTSHKQCNKWCVWFEHISQCHSMCVSPMVLSVGFCESGNKGFVERLVEAAVVTP